MATKTTGLATWKALRPHDLQIEYLNCPSRFVVVPAGRRSGKTECAKRRMIRKALNSCHAEDAWFIMGAPTHSQAKRIFWRDLKSMIPKQLLAIPPSEGTLTITLVNGAEITVVGLDAPERIEGRSIDGAVLDEYANMKGHVWGDHLRPALSDRLGWCDFIGVPEGRNHYYDLYKAAQADDSGDWATFTWTSEEILDKKEIESARRDLDELTFNQEYRASFVTFTGRAYYTFDEASHLVSCDYDPGRPLIFCFDFNVSPGVAVVVQEKVPDARSGEGISQVIGEVYIPNNSNTPAVCRKLIEDWGSHPTDILCYGDATGGARSTSAVAGSDWDLIKAELRPVFGSRVKFRVDRANPRERARVNAMNARLKTADGTIHMLLDPNKAPNVVKDLEGVRVLDGGAGEIDKKSDPKLTHLSDALGYYVVKKHPVAGARPITRTTSVLG